MNKTQSFNPLRLQTLRRKAREGTLTLSESQEMRRLLKMLSGPSENKAQFGPSENK